MGRLRASLLGCSVVMAVWLSDRCVWVLPGLIGVSLGVALSRRQPELDEAGDLPVALSSLLIIAGFVYLYVTFLVLELRRMLELFDLEEETAQPSWLFIGGVTALSLLLLGLGAALLLKLKLPSWLSKTWRFLLEER